jgi:HAD superfamily, subfamily IIIB (Acid phosphatase)
MVPEGARFASAADFKAPVRAAIERAGYTIIANMGDQPSDLAGGHAERTFLLPNPFYRIP